MEKEHKQTEKDEKEKNMKIISRDKLRNGK